MGSPYREERKPLDRSARRVLSAIRRGESLEEAAEKGGVTVGEIRAWRRDTKFAAQYGRAVRGEGGARLIAMNSIPLDDLPPQPWDAHQWQHDNAAAAVARENMLQRGRDWIAARFGAPDDYGRL